MRSVRTASQRPVVAWIACLALLAAALAPAIRHAIAATRGLPVVVAELCSAGGSAARMVIWAPRAEDPDPAGRPEGPAQRNGGAAGHCPACLGSADPAGPPPVAPPAFVMAPALQALASPAPLVAAVQAGWSPANPRAPPARG